MINGMGVFDILDLQEAAETAGMSESTIDEWFRNIRSGKKDWGDFEIAIKDAMDKSK